MSHIEHDNLATELSILGKNAQLSLTARQRVRDQLFKKIGQLDLVDAVQTNTEVPGLIMPLRSLLLIFKPHRVSFGLPATAGIALGIAVLTFATGAFAQTAQPGSGFLYTVRRSLEIAQVALITDPAKKAELQLAIANDRLETLQSANSATIQAALEESKKALTEAQNAVSKAKVSSTTKEDLNAKLVAIIGNQQDILSTIAKDNLTNDSVKEGILAFKEELDKIIDPTGEAIEKNTLPVGDDQPEILPEQPISGYLTLYGTLVTSFGQPAINSAGKVYVLKSVPVDLSSYIGNPKAQVTGVVGAGQIEVGKILFDSKLVWENPSKNNNNLPWVEGSQNSSLGKP